MKRGADGDAPSEPAKAAPARRSRDARGWRAKIAVIAPSTNTIVQPDFEDFARAVPGGGVTNHMGRISIPNMDISTDEGFWRLLDAVGGELDAAALRCMSARCDFMAMGMSAPTFFGGYEACVRKREQMAALCGVGVSSGSFACEAALKALRVTRIAVLSPYAAIGDVEVSVPWPEAARPNSVDVLSIRESQRPVGPRAGDALLHGGRLRGGSFQGAALPESDRNRRGDRSGAARTPAGPRWERCGGSRPGRLGRARAPSRDAAPRSQHLCAHRARSSGGD